MINQNNKGIKLKKSTWAIIFYNKKLGIASGKCQLPHK